MPSSKYPPALDLPLTGLVVDADDDRSAANAQADALLHFDRSAAGLRRYVRSFGLSREVTDDVVQEVFLSLFRHLCLGRPRHNLTGWLFRVGHNLALKERQSSKRRHNESPLDETLVGHLADAADNPEQRLASDRRRLRIRAVLRAMPERDQRCLQLRAEGLPYRDIAKALGISLGSVASTLTRALKRVTNADVG